MIRKIFLDALFSEAECSQNFFFQEKTLGRILAGLFERLESDSFAPSSHPIKNQFSKIKRKEIFFQRLVTGLQSFFARAHANPIFRAPAGTASKNYR